MKLVAIGCNIVFWGFFCMVMVTDGPPRGADILFSLLPFLMPVFNVIALRFISSPGRALTRVALAANILWFVIACWIALVRYPSHPEEEGLIAYLVLMAMTPLVSAVVNFLSLRRSPQIAGA